MKVIAMHTNPQTQKHTITNSHQNLFHFSFIISHDLFVNQILIILKIKINICHLNTFFSKDKILNDPNNKKKELINSVC